jgi:hypothetical protein
VSHPWTGTALTAALALLLAGCGGRGEVTPAPADPSSPAEVPQAGPPPGGEGCPRGSSSPVDKVLLRARSTDGVHWERIPDVLARGASSPQLVSLGDERWVVYVEDGERLARIPFGGGESERLEIEGAARGWQVDPHVVLLPDGGYRLYYIHPPERVDPGVLLENPVHSARSADGVHWEREPGVRIVGELVDPDVVPLADGRWRMYVTLRTNFVYSAVSSDGLTFVQEDGMCLQGGGVTSTLADGGGWRMFLHQPTQPPTKLLAATSTDGRTFTMGAEPVLVPEPAGPDRCGLESPSVLRDDEGWWLVYATVPVDGGGAG